MVPVWLLAIACAGLLVLSGLFSGLTLGLLSLDTTGLQIVAEAGTGKEREYASKYSVVLYSYIALLYFRSF